MLPGGHSAWRDQQSLLCADNSPWYTPLPQRGPPSLCAPSNPTTQGLQYHPHLGFEDEKTEAQRREVNCPKSDNW